MRFPQEENPSTALAGAATERIWACVSLQWDWLGGVMPERPAFAAPEARVPVHAA
jgi:hypothetical protein